MNNYVIIGLSYKINIFFELPQKLYYRFHDDYPQGKLLKSLLSKTDFMVGLFAAKIGAQEAINFLLYVYID